ncbi:hypothetical protein niasHS_002559 [Heterodera schachtii]|uniref:Uncharacterized protein n=1 Tax=Heterodera schachtii TaxID=97005 RepID=A0ABD2KKS2_HETSC
MSNQDNSETANIESFQAPVLELGDQPSKEFLELFSRLDSLISGELIEKAWKQYDTIGQQIILEGNRFSWMACAFFTTVWQATPFGQELICRYALSKLLSVCEITVLEFFDKLNSWVELISASRRLFDHVRRVQSNLAVAAVVFKKFLPIFRRVFVDDTQQTSIIIPSQKAKYKDPFDDLSCSSLFDFIWTLFVALRKQFSQSQEDLLCSFHLLLCLVDYVFDALQRVGQQRLLCSSFVQSLCSDGRSSLEFLCDEFDGVILEAKHLQIHWLYPRLNKLSAEAEIVGYGVTNGGLLFNIDENRRVFDQLYTEALMVRSEIDERMFLVHFLQNFQLLYDPEFDEQAVSFLLKFGDFEKRPINAQLMIKMTSQNCFEKLSNRKTNSRPPFVGKSYVITTETICPSALSLDEQNEAQKIRNLLSSFKGIEDDLLGFLFEDCLENPKEFVADQVETWSRNFACKAAKEIALNSKFDNEFQSEIAMRIAEIELLFYYLLQKVVTNDRERTVNTGMERHLDLGVIFQNLEFLASVFLCSSELILFACNSQRHFPWTMELFRDVVSPISFYKIFGLVVGANTGLSREAVNHLNRIEESVLEEFAWAKNSQLWSVLNLSHSFDAYGEPSPVPASLILGPSSASYIQRSIDLSPPIIIFFKKVYHLAAIRLSDLCERLRVADELIRHKAWTLFEHVFRTKTHLLMGRHLDQLLMCVLYIIAKICLLDTTFQEIMFHYRRQPQATSRIYRTVLMEDGNSSEDEPEKNYDDLISFYNRVFVNCVKDIVKVLHSPGSDGKENIGPLIPFPKISLNPLSPFKMIADRVNVMSMSQYAQNVAPPQQISASVPRGRYTFHQSPSKDLKSINALIGCPPIL